MNSLHSSTHPLEHRACRTGRVLPALLLLGLLLTACGHQQETPPPAQQPTATTVTVPVDLLPAFKLEVAEAVRTAMTHVIDIPATVLVDPTTTARVNSLIPGRIQSVLVQQGAHVSAGQALATVESMELGTMIADLIRSQSELTSAEAEYARVKTLHGDRVSSDRQLQAAESAHTIARGSLTAARKRLLAAGMNEADLTRLQQDPASFKPILTLRAPIAGVVAMRNAMVGQQISESQDLFEIVNLATVMIQGNVFDTDFGVVRPGLPVTLKVQAYPHAVYTGTIQSVSPQVDLTTHTLPVYCRITNRNNELRPNLHGQMQIRTTAVNEALIVPYDAIVFDGDERYVFVRSNDTTFTYVKVTTGESTKDQVAITGGIEPGAMVVMKNAFNLKSRLKLAASGDE